MIKSTGIMNESVLNEIKQVAYIKRYRKKAIKPTGHMYILKYIIFTLVFSYIWNDVSTSVRRDSDPSMIILGTIAVIIIVFFTIMDNYYVVHSNIFKKLQNSMVKRNIALWKETFGKDHYKMEIEFLDDAIKLINLETKSESRFLYSSLILFFEIESYYVFKTKLNQFIVIFKDTFICDENIEFEEYILEKNSKLKKIIVKGKKKK